MYLTHTDIWSQSVSYRLTLLINVLMYFILRIVNSSSTVKSTTLSSQGSFRNSSSLIESNVTISYERGKRFLCLMFPRVSLSSR